MAPQHPVTGMKQTEDQTYNAACRVSSRSCTKFSASNWNCMYGKNTLAHVPVTHVHKVNLTMHLTFLYPPQMKLRGYIVILMSVRSFVSPSVRSFVCPSQSLIRYSSKTAKQNFMKLSGIVHYMMPYCTSYFEFLSA